MDQENVGARGGWGHFPSGRVRSRRTPTRDSEDPETYSLKGFINNRLSLSNVGSGGLLLSDPAKRVVNLSRKHLKRTIVRSKLEVSILNFLHMITVDKKTQT